MDFFGFAGWEFGIVKCLLTVAFMTHRRGLKRFDVSLWFAFTQPVTAHFRRRKHVGCKALSRQKVA